MKRSLLGGEQAQLPVLPLEVTELIFSIWLAADDAQSCYRGLAKLRQVHPLLFRGRFSLPHIRHLLARFVAKLEAYMVELRVANSTIGYNPSFIYVDYYRMGPTPTTVLTNVWGNEEYSTELQRLLADRRFQDDAEQLWNLLTRIELSEAWRAIHVVTARPPPTERRRRAASYFALRDAKALFTFVRDNQRDGFLSPQLYYQWWDADTRCTRTAPLVQHSGLRRVTNMSAPAMAQFVQSYVVRGGMASRPPEVTRLAYEVALSASKIALYYDTVRSLSDRGSTEEERDRYARFSPRVERSAGSDNKQRLHDTVLCLAGNDDDDDDKTTPPCYSHIYSDAPEMREFRATLFHTTIDDQSAVTRLACLYRAMTTLPELELPPISQ